MVTKGSIIDTLNDLVRINYDRIAGYQRAIKETDNVDIDLNAVFTHFIQDSERYKEELESKIRELGEEPANDSTISGKIYRAWMDLKAGFSGGDRQSVIASCEYGEDAAQKAYAEALFDIEGIQHSDILQLISSQKESLKKAHDLMKKYRDTHEAMNK